ncbi:hypothetical protein FB473_002934 [Brooklawnia cerclae]|uniref:Uncharacterized protein n=1 Tax=Brooklawnia cerclae TaxID=349934 RepID=A0ABX0SIM0_9ACTN|nr:hypothetical protein [Brooklawnia cerclae]
MFKTIDHVSDRYFEPPAGQPEVAVFRFLSRLFAHQR